MSNSRRQLTTDDGDYSNYHAQAAKASRLVELTDERVNIFFEPKASFVGDPTARGHLFRGWLTADLVVGACIVLDDRQSQTLKQQLVIELRRIAQDFFDLAVEIAQIKEEPQEA